MPPVRGHTCWTYENICATTVSRTHGRGSLSCNQMVFLFGSLAIDCCEVIREIQLIFPCIDMHAYHGSTQSDGSVPAQTPDSPDQSCQVLGVPVSNSDSPKRLFSLKGPSY